MEPDTPATPELTESRRVALERTGRRWEYATTIWNTFEAVAAVVSGIIAHSLALVAFGLDSTVEVFASLVVLWHLGGDNETTDPARARRAMRLLAGAFAALGIYLVLDAAHGLMSRTKAETSPVGMVFLGATVIVMFILAWGKRRTGHALGNRPLIANARMAVVDGALAACILLALGLDTLIGWWWADPMAAGVVAVVALNEARELWSGE
jgi:divalent metal cation (Fe/Co/Zn/Cd) transporter